MNFTFSHNKVIFPDYGEVDFKAISDEKALELYRAGKFGFVTLSAKADKAVFAKLTDTEMEELKAILPKAELAKLKKVLKKTAK